MEKISDMPKLQNLLSQQKVSLLYISMPNCSVCTAVKPRLEKLAVEKTIPLYQMDAAETPLVASVFQVLTAPAVLLFSYGKEQQRQARFIDFNKLSQLIDALQKADATLDYEDLFNSHS
ncbi:MULTISPECIES: thioredoxin family protein [unclassified Enterococcus]|uniref:thioredoxin family protein n=1 Tax=unclassified Enterococcus TaxID=2608891 RepID=UPI0024768822|nr:MULTISPECIES: thioredoxin family protein [unclassified Enterococcus]